MKFLQYIMILLLLHLLSCNGITDPNIIKDVDGNIYNTVTIGNQTWMAENLKVTHYRNGEEIQYLTNDTLWALDTTGAYCIYENDILLADSCGLLYNWYSIYNPNGLAPVGWHIPTDEEWKELEIFLGMDPEETDFIGIRGTTEGYKLKTTYGWEWSGNGSNEYGFSALPYGSRYVLLSLPTIETRYILLGYSAYYWSLSDGRDKYSAWCREINYSLNTIQRRSLDKKRGLSVRCIKDSE